MSSTITKVFVAALALGIAQARPQPSMMDTPAQSSRASHSVSSVKVASATVGTSSAATATATGSASSPPNNDDLIATLLTQPTAIKRFQKLLTEAGNSFKKNLNDFVVFDFGKKKAALPNSKGGELAAANIDTFPILTDLGISTTVAFLGPCGMNTPHVHPRATEFLTLVDGDIDFGFILENGLIKTAGASQEVRGSLSKFQGTVFPMGSIHYQVNTKCAPATFVATLNSEDPGTSQVAQNFFGLNPDVVNSTLGFPAQINGDNIEQFRKSIPANLALAIDQCIKNCPEAKSKLDEKSKN